MQKPGQNGLIFEFIFLEQQFILELEAELKARFTVFIAPVLYVFLISHYELFLDPAIRGGQVMLV